MTAITLAKTASLKSSTDQTQVTREEQFNQLIAVYMDDLYRYGYWLSGSHAVADDLVQETLVRAWKSMDKLNDIRAVKGWLLTILRRENARRRMGSSHPLTALVSFSLYIDFQARTRVSWTRSSATAWLPLNQ